MLERLIPKPGRLVRLNPLRSRALVLALFVILGVAHSFSLPIFEGIDEGKHYLFIHDIVEARGLPSQIGYDFDRSHEASQTPLYYIPGALLISGIDRSDLASIYFLSPNPGSPVQYDHAADELSLRPTGTVLAVRLLRLYSLAWGALMLWLIGAALVRAGLGEESAAMGMAAIGLNPRFIHNAATITNDVAVACMGAALLWLLARRHPNSGARWLWSVGAVCGLAFLSKLNGLVLLPVSLLACWMGISTGSGGNAKRIKLFVFQVAHILFAFAAITSLYFLANWAQYGQLLPVSEIGRANATALRSVPLQFGQGVAIVLNTVTHLWAELGAGAVLGNVARWMWLGVYAAGVLGAITATRVLKSRHPWIVLVWVQALIGILAWLPWVILFDVGVDQPRLWGVGLAAVNVGVGLGIAWGYDRLAVRWRRQRAVSTSIILVLSLISATVIPEVLLPMYRQRPALVPAAQISGWKREGAVAWDNGLEIVHVEMRSNRVQAGKTADLQVAVRATRFISEAHLLNLEIRAPSGQLVSRRSLSPLERWPTTRWSSGGIYSATVSIDVPDAAAGVLDVLAGWRAYEPPNRIALRTDGGGVSAPIGRIRVTGNPVTPVIPDGASRLDTIAILNRFAVDSDTVSTEWLVLRATATDLTFFLHGLDAEGRLVAQNDTPPSVSAHFWEPGDIVEVVFHAPGLARAQTVLVGAYTPDTGARRTVYRPDGSAWPNNAIVLRGAAP